MDFSSIEKFIQTMGIEVKFDVERDFINSSGKRYMCIGIHGYYLGEQSYVQYHCYEITNQGLMMYSDGNEVQGVRDSIFAYLGEDKLVERYFEKKAREFAKSFFEYHY